METEHSDDEDAESFVMMKTNFTIMPTYEQATAKEEKGQADCNSVNKQKQLDHLQVASSPETEKQENNRTNDNSEQDEEEIYAKN